MGGVANRARRKEKSGATRTEIENAAFHEHQEAMEVERAKAEVKDDKLKRSRFKPKPTKYAR